MNPSWYNIGEWMRKINRAYVLLSALIANALAVGYWIQLEQCTPSKYCLASAVVQGLLEYVFIGVVGIAILGVLLERLLRQYYTHSEGDSE
jgi:peptidoglycan biosynthesis protein MviN/MurJ (putative lipid II flippase)